MQPSIKSVFLICFLFFSYAGLAQNGGLKGVVSDTANKKDLQQSVIALIDKKDSTLYRFTRSGQGGKFEMKNLPAGVFVLVVTSPGFADYVDSISLEANASLDLGVIHLTNKISLLKEIVIKAASPVRMKGDTMEFTADSFATSANANAEELLKRLPGIQVNKNGEIIAQGERVEKVLVDGEEFFSDDPTLATRNIRADQVDKVQVFDKKSDQVEFTGIDDGQKTKTINLKLKDDKKNGYFGRVKAGIGGGQKTFASNEAMINAFKAKRKISAFGTMDNTGSTGLTWEDRRNYEGNQWDVEYDDNSGWMMTFGEWDPFENNSQDGEGLPTAYTAGGHYSNKWNDDKSKVNSNYVFKKLDTDGTTETRSQFILPDTSYTNNQFRDFESERLRHTIRGIYDVSLDSTSSLKFSGRAYREHLRSGELFRTEALNDQNERVNSSVRSNDTEGDKTFLNGSLLWRKKMRKKGRTLSARLNANYQKTDTDGFLFSLNDFYEGGDALLFRDTIDQFKRNYTDNLQFDSKFTYTEPLGKSHFIEVRAGVSMINSSANRETFNSVGGKYTEVDSTFTNHYDFDILLSSGGLGYRIVKKKYNIAFGSDVALQSYRQKDLDRNLITRYYRTNLFPNFNLRYNIKPQNGIGFFYNGSTLQPTIQQIQPIADNTDPLNISVGNPNLKPAFSHNFSVFMYNYKVLKERNYNVNFNLNLVSNSIVTLTTVDSLGRRLNQSVNGKTNTNFNFWSRYYMKLQKWNIRVNGGVQGSANRYNNFVNGTPNVTDNLNIGPSIGLDKEKAKKYGVYLNLQASYNRSVSSVNEDLKTNYWTLEPNLNMNFELPLKFNINTEFTYYWREKTAVFPTNNNVALWNATFGKKLFKEKGLLALTGKDILNQNRGFERNISSNFITERRFAVIRRLFLVSFTYNFNKNGAMAGNN